MKLHDYKRLSNISIKSRKKTTRTTVSGISFGLILLMPLLFIIIAFYIDLNAKVNEDDTIRVFNISVSEEKTKQNYSIGLYEEYVEDVLNHEGITNSLKLSTFYFENSISNIDGNNGDSHNLVSVILNDKEIDLGKKYKDPFMNRLDNYKIGLQIIDSSYKINPFLVSDYRVSKANPLVCGRSFSDNSKGEIMVSSTFLKDYNLKADEVINKPISIRSMFSYPSRVTYSKSDIVYENYEYLETEYNIITEYTIIGIYDGEIYSKVPRVDSGYVCLSEEYGYKMYFWLTSDSLYNSDGETVGPEIVSIENRNEVNDYVSIDSYYFYPDEPIDLYQHAREEKVIFLPLGYGVEKVNLKYKYNLIVEYDNFYNANKASKEIEELIIQSSTSNDEIYNNGSYMNPLFLNYQIFYTVFLYVCISLGIFGGIIFFATLLNLYNTIHYSVESRKNYLGLTRAIGMKDKDVLKLYFVEILQIFKRSYIISGIIGGLLCYGLIFLFDSIMSSNYMDIIQIKLSLNPIYILITFGLLIMVNTLISIIYAYIATYKVVHKPILEVLIDEK